MKYLRHPITGEVCLTGPLHAKRLRRYGWQDVTRKEYLEWQRAKIGAAVIRNVQAAQATHKLH